MPQLAALYRYPLKSGRAQALTHSHVNAQGLLHDRTWMLASLNGVFLSARTHPQLLLISTTLRESDVVFNAPNMPELCVRNADELEAQTVQVWDDQFSAQTSHQQINDWFSSYLQQQVMLVWLGAASERRVRRFPETPISFVDGYPVLLIGEGSLNELNRQAGQDFAMLRFRPNLVVGNTAAFVEDSWRQIRIGDVIFDVVRPCERCVMITLDPDTAQKHPRQEPLRTLAKFRNSPDGVLFGQHLIARQAGELAIGMPVEILK